MGRLEDLFEPEGVEGVSEGLSFVRGGGEMIFTAAVGGELGEVPVPPSKDVSGLRVKIFQGVEHRRAEGSRLAVIP